MNKTFSIFIFGLVLVSSVSACGWVTYEDIEETRFYYNQFDILDGVEDSVLLMSREPHPQEVKMNVYIPMIYNG